ncbi:MAG: cysteine desulfurase [Ignavibacteriae bacterium]|nr:cysteine desulfurase [Ignavibacteriota bacterium]
MIEAQTHTTELTFDVEKTRKDFPILNQQVRGKPLVYLDNAATSQKPQVVIDSLVRYYTEFNSNVHRGVHLLSEQATEAYENSRLKTQRFINAKRSEEIIFTRGTTDGINLIAQSFGRANVHEGDEIIISGMEHHSNIVPWQMLCAEKKATLRVIPIDDKGEIILDDFEKLFNNKTRLLALTHVSNALGTINPIKQVIETAHKYNVPVSIDGAQAVPHLRVDVQELDCDFYVFSSHKMFGPTGIGILYGKKSLLEVMPPYQGGGDMIKSVTFEKTIYNELPYKFEAGTPNIADTVAFGATIDYLNTLDYEAIHNYEQELLEYATGRLSTIDGLTIIGTAREKTGVISFTLDGIHPHDIGTILDTEGIAIRTGHHCAQPVMQRFNVPATARASFAFYNTKDEADVLVNAINKVKEMFS